MKALGNNLIVFFSSHHFFTYFDWNKYIKNIPAHQGFQAMFPSLFPLNYARCQIEQKLWKHENLCIAHPIHICNNHQLIFLLQLLSSNYKNQYCKGNTKPKKKKWKTKGQLYWHFLRFTVISVTVFRSFEKVVIASLLLNTVSQNSVRTQPKLTRQKRIL